MKRDYSRLLPLGILFCLLLFLPLVVQNLPRIQKIVSQATGTTANISIDAAVEMEQINPVWQAFAQGGEASTDMLAPVISQVTALHPQYIRIDHIYDHFNLVSRSNGQIVFNFTELDKIVNSILKTGALPFFSLSYMPKSLAENDDITAKPNNWNDWAYIVQKTVEHYSGVNNFSLNNVYYEVWNEPDLFGNWKTYGDKNYLTLYQYAVLGAQNSQTVNNFKIGGPATTGLYENWVKELADYVTENNLRLDFFSWHRYDTNPNQFATDISNINKILINYPNLVHLPRIVSEWGFNSKNDSAYDSNLAAVHTLAAVRQGIYGYTYLFSFELVDGRSPDNQKFWGRWGILTHPDFDAAPKPRYQAFLLLNQISGKRLSLTGEGTWVSAISSKDQNSVKVLLINYDTYSTHSENIPVTIKNIVSGNYILKRQRLGQTTPAVQNLEISGTSFSTEEILSPNSALLLELTEKSASL